MVLYLDFQTRLPAVYCISWKRCLCWIIDKMISLWFDCECICVYRLCVRWHTVPCWILQLLPYLAYDINICHIYSEILITSNYVHCEVEVAWVTRTSSSCPELTGNWECVSALPSRRHSQFCSPGSCLWHGCSIVKILVHRYWSTAQMSSLHAYNSNSSHNLLWKSFVISSVDIATIPYFMNITVDFNNEASSHTHNKIIIIRRRISCS